MNYTPHNKIFFCSPSRLLRSMVLHWAIHSKVQPVSDAANGEWYLLKRLRFTYLSPYNLNISRDISQHKISRNMFSLQWPCAFVLMGKSCHYMNLWRNGYDVVKVLAQLTNGVGSDSICCKHKGFFFAIVLPFFLNEKF